MAANSHRPSRYRAVILDMDGTLVDSNAAHVKAWVEALREHGHEVSEKDIWPLVGMGGDNLLPAAVGIDKESEEGKKISERRSRDLPRAPPPSPEAVSPGPPPAGADARARPAPEGGQLLTQGGAREVAEIAGAADLVEGASSGS